VEFSLSGIGLEMSDDAVRSRLGEPIHAVYGSRLTWYLFDALSVGLATSEETGQTVVSWVIQSKGAGPAGLRIGDTGERARKRFGGQELSDGLRRSDENGSTLDVLLEDDRVRAFVLTRAGREAPKQGLGGFPQFEFRGVNLLMMPSEVQAILGQPSETYSMEYWQSWVYPGLTLNLAPVDGSDRVIWLMLKEGEVLPGLSLGDSHKRVTGVFCPASEDETFYLSLVDQITLHNERNDQLCLWLSNESLAALTLDLSTHPAPVSDSGHQKTPGMPSDLDGVRVRMTQDELIKALGAPDVVWDQTSKTATWLYLERGLRITLHTGPDAVQEVVDVKKSRGSWESIWIGEPQTGVEALLGMVALVTDVSVYPVIELVNPATGDEFSIYFDRGRVTSFYLSPRTGW